MLELIGVLVWFLFSLWLTVVPIFTILSSPLLGGFVSKIDKLIVVVISALALANWYFFITKINISVTTGG